MPPPGEALKNPSTLRAAKPWWGEQQQADKAVAGSDALILKLGKAGVAGELWRVDGNSLVFMSPNSEIQ